MVDFKSSSRACRVNDWRVTGGFDDMNKSVARFEMDLANMTRRANCFRGGE